MIARCPGCKKEIPWEEGKIRAACSFCGTWVGRGDIIPEENTGVSPTEPKPKPSIPEVPAAVPTTAPKAAPTVAPAVVPTAVPKTAPIPESSRLSAEQESTIAKLFEDAVFLLKQKLFSDAFTMFSEIVHSYPNDYRGYWGRALARFPSADTEGVTEEIHQDLLETDRLAPKSIQEKVVLAEKYLCGLSELDQKRQNILLKIQKHNENPPVEDPVTDEAPSSGGLTFRTKLIKGIVAIVIIQIIQIRSENFFTLLFVWAVSFAIAAYLYYSYKTDPRDDNSDYFHKKMMRHIQEDNLLKQELESIEEKVQKYKEFFLSNNYLQSI